MVNKKGYSQIDESQLLNYLPLVDAIVDKIKINSRQGMDRDDYVSLGVIGLIDAFKKFDASKKVPFKHYAKWRIKGAIYDELRKNGTVSRSKIDKLNKVYKAKQLLQQQLQKEPTDEEVCVFLGITMDELSSSYIVAHFLATTFLDETLFSSENEEFVLLDFIKDEKSPNPVKEVETEEKLNLLTGAIDTLSEREKIILNLYYNEELHLKDIAEILKISISRVSQIHGKLLIKLKHKLVLNGVDNQ